MTWLAAGLLALLAAVPAVGQDQQPDDLGLSVTAGFDGRRAASGWVPVEVVVHPARLVAGTLEIESSGNAGPIREQRSIEVAAGSRKLYRFVVPDGLVVARVVEPGRARPPALRARGTVTGDEFLVGALGGAPATPTAVRHDPSGMTGVWAGVDPAWLELSPRSLDSLSALVADPAQLDELAPRARANLAAAVVAGLDLVVSDGQGSGAPAWLPWQPSVETTPGVAVADAGRGRVLVTGTDGLRLLGPRPGLAGHSDWAVERNPWEFPRLLHEPGGTVPALPWLSVFILGYVIVVGPANALVLSRFRRRELAWVTVPLVTVIFTTGAFLGAVGGRPPLGATARLASWVDGAATETIVAGARSPTPGDHRLVLDGDGWSLQPMLPGGRPATLSPVLGGVAVEFDLGALEMGGLLATRASDEPAPLEVEAVERGGGLEVSVRNVGARAVLGVSVHAATATRRVGDLGSGETATTTIEAQNLPSVDPHGRPQAAGGPPRTLDALLTSGLRDGSPGLVWAVGEVDEPVAGVRSGGRDTNDLGTLVAVAARPTGDQPGLFGVARAALSTRQDMYQLGPLAVEGAGPVFLRLRFPAGARPAALVSHLDAGARHFGAPELAVWDHAESAWQPVEAAFPDGRGDPGRLLGPTGEVWVRATGELFPFDFSARTITGAP